MFLFMLLHTYTYYSIYRDITFSENRKNNSLKIEKGNEILILMLSTENTLVDILYRLYSHTKIYL